MENAKEKTCTVCGKPTVYRSLIVEPCPNFGDLGKNKWSLCAPHHDEYHHHSFTRFAKWHPNILPVLVKKGHSELIKGLKQKATFEMVLL